MKKGNVTFDWMDSNDSTFPHGQEGQEKFKKNFFAFSDTFDGKEVHLFGLLWYDCRWFLCIVQFLCCTASFLK